MSFIAGTVEVIVIGAGHAGIEAALAAARLGRATLCVCTSLDAIGNLPCNPSIGGTAKGQIVREIDALGGEMARAADRTCLQFRMLNRGKGPAVHSPRCQSDRKKYTEYMKTVLEHTDNLTLIQGECVDILTEEGRVTGVRLSGGACWLGQAVVLATGTFLEAKTFTGDTVREIGPDGLYAAKGLSHSLRRLGLGIRRFKTGTPPRIDGRTVDFSRMERQQGDQDPQGFAFDRTDPVGNSASCWLTYTNEATHQVILGALDRSPLYSGVIEGVGPRYCPSIEDKLVRFSDKPRHQVFLEPCGENTFEYYLQGLSTSLPEDVQTALIRTIPGMERAVVMRPGYAIEYDCIDPLCLEASLSIRGIPGLYAAGQLCGSSGYEEAAGQGLIAGINSARYVTGQDPVILRRSDGYIGTLIDDLVTRGTEEPYRMMTSRCEYRLLTRQDNADRRLMPLGAEIGLISKARLAQMEEAYRQAEEEIKRLNKTIAPPREEVNRLLTSLGTTPLSLSGASLAELLRRPQIGYADLAPIDPERPALSHKVREQVEIHIKYEGYIKRQEQDLETKRRMEDHVLPSDIDYQTIRSIRIEARQKLERVRPRTLGQAARISGVSPADIGALIVWLSRPKSENSL